MGPGDGELVRRVGLLRRPVRRVSRAGPPNLVPGDMNGPWTSSSATSAPVRRSESACVRTAPTAATRASPPRSRRTVGSWSFTARRANLVAGDTLAIVRRLRPRSAARHDRARQPRLRTASPGGRHSYVRRRCRRRPFGRLQSVSNEPRPRRHERLDRRLRSRSAGRHHGAIERRGGVEGEAEQHEQLALGLGRRESRGLRERGSSNLVVRDGNGRLRRLRARSPARRDRARERLDDRRGGDVRQRAARALRRRPLRGFLFVRSQPRRRRLERP